MDRATIIGQALQGCALLEHMTEEKLRQTAQRAILTADILEEEIAKDAKAKAEKAKADKIKADAEAKAEKARLAEDARLVKLHADEAAAKLKADKASGIALTLAGNGGSITADASTFYVSAPFPSPAPFQVTIDKEPMLIGLATGTLWSNVTRAYNPNNLPGISATAHTDGASIY